MPEPVFLSLSPRADGNSDQCADFFVRALGRRDRVAHVRDFRILPCTACGGCEGSGRCALAAQDQTEELFALLDGASALVLTAPIYFYHLPGSAKIWIDRAQSRYEAARCAKAPALQTRPAYAALIAGRTRGEHLFRGVWPTLRLFLELFSFRLCGTAELRGLEGPGAFAASQDARAEIRRLAASMEERLACSDE